MLKKVKAIIEQYFYEIAIVFLIASTYISQQTNNNLLYIFINTIICMVLIKISYILTERIVNKKIGQILSLTRRNRICMMPKHCENIIRAFTEDFDNIIKYARKKHIKEMQTKTHRFIVWGLVRNYLNSCNKNDVCNQISEMVVDQEICLDMIFGKMQVRYIGKEINNCNRYSQKKKGENWLARVLKEKDTYILKFHVDDFPVSDMERKIKYEESDQSCQ